MMPYTARSHDEARKVLCILCFKKGKDVRPLSNRIRMLIEKHCVAGIDFDDVRLPSRICTACRLTLDEYEKGIFSRNIETFDYAQIPQIYMTRLRSTSLQSKCECLVCEISRQNINNKSNCHPGRPSSKSPPKALKLCSSCLSALHQGKPHKCSKSSMLSNLSELASDRNCEQNFACAILENTSFDGSPVNLSRPGGGHPLRVHKTQNSPKSPNDNLPMMSTSDMFGIQKDLNLSSRETLKLGQHIRKVSGSRKVIESSLKNKLYDQNHLLDEWFEIKTIDFVKIEQSNVTEQTPRTVVVCKDVQAFIHQVMIVRGIDESNVMLKIGLDGGHGSLKICASLIDKSSYSNELTTTACSGSLKKYSDTGVKQLMILAIAPDVQESYENVKKLWIHCNLHNLSISYTIACDLKLGNVMFGLMSHGSMHPCTWCKSDRKSLADWSQWRTIGDIKRSFWEFHDGDKKRSQAKHFYNVIHPPIVSTLNLEQPILDIYPPPELHLLLGAVNTMYKGLSVEWGGSDRWPKKLHLEREAYYGGSFTGNSCMILLKNVDTLQSICPLHCLRYVDAFRKFYRVVNSCFGFSLNPEYQKFIEDFKNSYLALEISVTPKLHAIFYHVGEFCERRQQGLGLFSEQAFESVHHDFSQVWEDFKVKNIHHPKFGERFIQAVCSYNSRHL